MQTLLVLAHKLGIDFEAAKKAPGKPSDVFFEHFEKLRTENEQHQIDNASLNFQLAEAQLENQALRGYLEKIQEIASQYRDGVKFNYITDICQEALSQKQGASAINSIRATVAKQAGEVMRDRCERAYWVSPAEFSAQMIRLLPDVSLGDIGALEAKHANGAPTTDRLPESHESTTVTAPTRKKPGG